MYDRCQDDFMVNLDGYSIDEGMMQFDVRQALACRSCNKRNVCRTFISKCQYDEKTL
jgi:hypothetical protein